jgi:hypothetical protein
VFRKILLLPSSGHNNGTASVSYLTYFVTIYQSRRFKILELRNINIRRSGNPKSHTRNVITLCCVMCASQDEHIHHCPTLIDWLVVLCLEFCSFGYGDDDGMLPLGRGVLVWV